MASHRVFIKRSAQKEIRALPTKKPRLAIVAEIQSLADDPRPARCIKLSGTPTIHGAAAMAPPSRVAKPRTSTR